MLSPALSELRKKHRQPEPLALGHPVCHMRSWEDPQPRLSLSREIIIRTALSFSMGSEESDRMTFSSL